MVDGVVTSAEAMSSFQTLSQTWPVCLCVNVAATDCIDCPFCCYFQNENEISKGNKVLVIT